MAFRVLLHEQDNAFREVLSYCLTQEGWEVESFEKGSRAPMPLEERPDVCIIDTDDEEGFRVIKYIMKQADQRIPIIATSERERVINRVLGLELGCDDFVVKPYLPRELVLRIRRVLEKEGCSGLQDARTAQRRIQAYCVDSLRRTVSFKGQDVALTSKEFELLLLFMEHKDMALSREQIISSVWGDNYFGSDRVVDDLIRRVRRKVKYLKIETLYGYGYMVTS